MRFENSGVAVVSPLRIRSMLEGVHNNIRAKASVSPLLNI